RMFGLNAARCSVTPISSATEANRFLNTSRLIASTAISCSQSYRMLLIYILLKFPESGRIVQIGEAICLAHKRSNELLYQPLCLQKRGDSLACQLVAQRCQVGIARKVDLLIDLGL